MMLFTYYGAELTYLRTHSQRYSEATRNQSDAYWDAAVAYEWSKNLASENVTGDRYPFILCNNAANMSGYQRMAMLADNFPSDDYLNHSKVIFNTDEGMCQLAHVFPSEAVEVEGDEFIVQVRDVCRRSDNCSYS